MVETSRGARELRKAPATQAFWVQWRANKDALKACGISVSQSQKEAGVWEVCWWKQPADAAYRAQAIEQSRAVDATVEVPCPDGLQYMGFQKAGIAYIKEKAACLIGDEMGLGKTIQAIGLINSDPKRIRRILIIGKLTLLRNWERELRKWLVDQSYTIGIATGQTFPTADIVLINFDVLHKWPQKLTNYWDLVIVDEAHYLKNRNARRTKCVVGYKPTRKEAAAGMLPTSGIPAKRKLLLTGTPFENRPDELWTLLNYLDPAAWPSYWGFAKKFCGLENNGFGVTVGNGRNLDTLNRILRERYMIRRLKRDVLTELPPKTRVIVELECDDDEWEDEERSFVDTYGDEIAEAEAEMELAGASDDADAFAEAVKRLRSSKQIAFTEMARVRHNTAVRKVPQVIEQLEGELEEVDKLLVFAHHHDVIHPIAAHFGKAAVVVDGETPVAERDAAVQRFQTDPECKVFVGSIRAAGEGLTLTAATLVVFAEEDWVPGKISQCEDRAHRIGQRDNVLVKHYVLPRSIDAKMAKTHVAKQEIADKALDDVVKAEALRQPVTFVQRDAAVHVTRSQNDIQAERLTDADVELAHQSIRCIAGMCDGAQALDGHGFNKLDTAIGKRLAGLPSLSRRQGALALRLANKYRRQLGTSEPVVEAFHRMVGKDVEK